VNLCNGVDGGETLAIRQSTNHFWHSLRQIRNYACILIVVILFAVTRLIHLGKIVSDLPIAV